MKSNSLLCFLFSLLLLTSPLAASANNVVCANSDSPGSTIDLAHFLATDKTTVLFIHSPHCGPCKLIEPKIQELSDKKTDIKIVDVLLDSEADGEIGFMSPAGNQFEVYVVPMFIIYDEHGKKISQGKKALKQVKEWLTEQGISS
jgi:thiol-disulfide isomerase/thioredoxin